MLLTGDQLNINSYSYSICDKNGDVFFLGKLLKREKAYSPFHEAYSLYNNVFVFEHMPSFGVQDYHNTPKFTIANTGNE